jgi:glycosyltransferase involved in cell wall biosynthesis
MNGFASGSPNRSRLRVLLVPDSVYWVTGTIAKSIARFNPWIEATIASGPVIDTIFADHPELMSNFDLVHFICPYASRVWLPRFRDLIPCVTSHHHVSDWDLLKHNLDGDSIIVGSPEWAEDLHRRGADISKVFCVFYGVDANQFKPATDAERSGVRKKLGIPPHETVIGFFGKNSSNEHDRKGINVFTKAILALRQRMPGLIILIVGPGWKELVSSINSSGVKCIWFPFVRDDEDLATMYGALDFYWVTARIEGGPVTLLEAMSSEVCCLTTPVGVAREIVRDGHNALLMSVNDPQCFVEGTAALAQDPTERRRIGRNARQTILEQMDVGVTSRRVRDVYERAFESFSARRNCSAPFDVLELAASVASADRPVQYKENVVPLSGFPSEIHQRVRMLETLMWSEHLILYHQQRAVALKLILQEWWANPLSLLPARVLLRRFLPVPLVGRVVKLKNRSRVTPQLVPNCSPTEKA